MLGSEVAISDIFLGVMRAAEGRIGDAAADPDHGYREVLIAKIVAHHLKGAVEREGGDGIGERPEAAQRHAGAEPDHDLFGNACVDEALGEILAELLDRAGG